MNVENKKQMAIILFAVVLGLVAAVLVGSHIQTSIQHETAMLAKEYEEKKIQPLLKEVTVLRQEVQTLATRQVALLQQQQAGGGAAQAEKEAPTDSLAVKTPAGKRALTVLIDSLSAVGGMIAPGDYVDIMAHLKVPPPPNVNLPSENVSAILFQNVQVLAVGTNLGGVTAYDAQQKAGSLNITFAVDPEEAGLLTFAQHNGKLQLVLRSPEETDVQMMQPASWDSLAEYALDKSGLELAVPRSRAMIQSVGGAMPASHEVKPYIQIFKGGREL